MVEFDLGKMEKKDLHTVWKHEERDFSRWLAMDENLELLGKAINIDIQLERKEAAVEGGKMSADIFAIEANTDRKIVIENQLGVSDPDHLGKVITYAACLDAKILIWIVKRAKPEFRKAVKWLNAKTDSDIAIFLIEMELWQIGDSKLAPRFNVVERPDESDKEIKYEQGLSETKRLQLEFWQQFGKFGLKEQTEFRNAFTLKKPLPQSWYSIAIGSVDATIELRFVSQRKKVYAGIYIMNNKPLYQGFVAKKEEIEQFIGAKLEWKDSVFLASKEIDVNNRDSWNDAFQWLCDMSLKFKACYQRFYQEVPLGEEQDTNMD